jgi:hypothetical protein
VSGPTFRGMAVRRLLALLGLAAAAGALASCGGSTTVSADALSAGELSQAAARSAEAPTGRFELALDMTFPGMPAGFAFSGEGAFDTEAKRASVTLDLSSLAGLLGGLAGGLGGPGAPDLGDPEGWKIDVVQDGEVVYVRFPAIAAELPEGKSWVRVDPSSTGKTGDFGFDLSQVEQLTGNDLRGLLDFVKAVSGEIETVGTEELRGVATTHYRATFDLLAIDRLVPPAQQKELGAALGELVEQSGLAEIPFDVWIDESGYIRKVESTFSATPEGSKDALEASVSFELYDYGADVDITAPVPDDVVDASALD